MGRSFFALERFAGSATGNGQEHHGFGCEIIPTLSESRGAMDGISSNNILRDECESYTITNIIIYNNGSIGLTNTSII